MTNVALRVTSNLILMPVGTRLTYIACKHLVDEINRRAERKIEMTGVLEGAHHAAMTEILAELKEMAERQEEAFGASSNVPAGRS